VPAIASEPVHRPRRMIRRPAHGPTVALRDALIGNRGAAAAEVLWSAATAGLGSTWL